MSKVSKDGGRSVPLKGELSTPTPPPPGSSSSPRGRDLPIRTLLFSFPAKAFVIGNQKVLVGETERHTSLDFWGFRKSLPFALYTLVTLVVDFFHSAWQVPGPGLRAEAFFSVGLWFRDNLNGWPAWWPELISKNVLGAQGGSLTPPSRKSVFCCSQSLGFHLVLKA